MTETSHSKDHYFKTPIFVLGLPRSGTSLVAGVLKICGAWLGNTVPGGGQENPKGFFENIYLREQINKTILNALKVDPLGVNLLPDSSNLPPINGLTEMIEQGLQADGYGYTQPWLFKDAKITLLWPAYLKAFPNAHWVIVRRDSKHIISSCLNTSFMRQHSSDPHYWSAWIDEYLSRLEDLKQATSNYTEIWTPSLIEGDTSTLKEMNRSLALSWNEEEVTKFITPEYWHFK